MFISADEDMIYVYSNIDHLLEATAGSGMRKAQFSQYVLEKSESNRHNCRIVKDRTGTFNENSIHNMKKMLQMIEILLDNE